MFTDTVSLESLLEAWDKFKRGKTRKVDVQKFELHLGDNLFQLHEALMNLSYQHGPYEHFYVRDPKVRLVHKTSIRNRIVNHTVFRTLNEIFEPLFIYDSYSCRKRKGSHRAVVALKEYANYTLRTYGKCFVLKCDIKKFFHSINHDILLRIIEKNISDPQMMWLIKSLVSSFSSSELNRERERERE